MHRSFRSASLVALLTVFTSPLFAFAGTATAYDAAAFNAAQGAGQPIVVEIHAEWCTECRVQSRILGRLTGEPAYAGLVWLRVDYDRQKQALKDLAVRKESTLIVYRGAREVARATGITAEVKIRALLDQAF